MVAISVYARFIVASARENSDITANAFRGNGGRVNITAQGIYGIQPRQASTAFSDITASSQFGVSGIVTLNTPDFDPSRGLVELPVALTDPSNQIAQTCSPQVQATNSFTSIGRGGIPTNPSQALSDDTTIVP